MTTAYKLENRLPKKTFDGLPEQIVLSKTGDTVEFDVYREELDFKSLYEICAEIIEEGQTYPQETIDEQEFRQFYLSFHCFVFRLSQTKQTIGGFYIKPNFPGRSSHLANFGLAVSSKFRGRGIGKIMVEKAVHYARIIGYEALYTNLVYVSNPASIKACMSQGFVEVGRLPRAGNLKGLGFTDALQLYKRLDIE